MKRILSAVLAVSLMAGAGAAAAQPQQYDHRGDDRGSTYGDHRDDRGGSYGDRNDRRDDHRGDYRDGQRWDHHNWRRGGRVDREEWRRGHRIDYRMHHLRRPPRGYEWREVNGDYVLGAVATGLIADLLLNNH